MKYVLYCLALGFATGCVSSKTKKNVESSVSVLSYNIHHANPPSRPGIIDLQAIAKVIQQEHPDLVALQEVDVFTGRSGKSVNQAAELGRLTGMNHYFAKAIDHDGGEYGVAILSKYPMEDTKHFPLPTIESTGGERRTLAVATIVLPGNKRVIFACTHLDAQRNDTNRVQQVQHIKEVLGTEKKPVIIAGDFNAEPGSGVVQSLDDVFQRGCAGNCGFTIPEINPSKEIDFIAYKPSKSFNVKEYKVVEETYASDHRPVKAILLLK